MKQNSTPSVNKFFTLALAVLLVLVYAKPSQAQVTLSLGSPVTYVYGLTANGEILEINTGTAKTNRVIKNSTYPGKSPSNSNGLGYNSINGKFYYFKRNYGASPEEFVSFQPSTGTVVVLAASTITDEVHTGCVSNDGKGYYTVDTKGVLSYYNIAANTWKVITSNIVDQYNADVDAVIRNQNAGDMAIDGYGNVYIVTSSDANYGLYKIPAPLPTASVAKLTINRVIAPTTATPTGNSFAGIAFDANGRIFMGTKGDDRLYLLQNTNTLTYVAKFQNSDASNDLTSLNFPLVSVLPVKWVSFDASLQNNNAVTLDWNVIEEKNQGFYVQHSSDATNWKDITFIKSRNIAETEQNYMYAYSANLSGRQYYRIKQVDIDGKESFSTVKILTFKSQSSDVAVWPNPARDIINIDNDGTETSVVAKAQVYSLSGKLSLEKKLQQGLNTIDISTLPAGAYIVKANTSRGNAFTQKIIKQ